MQIKHLKLHHYPATRSARVKWMLHEVVGDKFELALVDLYGGAQYKTEFLALNPNHGVPVLEVTWESGATQVLIESAAMLTFLADSYPDSGLAPAVSAAPARADYLQTLHFGATTMDMMLWQMRIHMHVLPLAERDPRSVVRYRNKFALEVEPRLARRLARTRFILGDNFSAADCVIGHNVLWARSYGLCADEVFRRYLSNLSKRPAFASAFADAGQFVPEVAPELPLAGRFTG